MILRQLWHPRTLLALGALIALLVIAACGGTATPDQADDSGGSETAATPTLDPFAGVQEPTPTARLDATNTPVPVPTAMAADRDPIGG